MTSRTDQLFREISELRIATEAITPPVPEAGAPEGDPGPPLPAPWAVLYSDPMPDGERRSCGNCSFWIRPLSACVVHPKDLEVTSEHVCGYHVSGQPQSTWLEHPGLVAVKPEYSGLVLAPGGAACDRCRYYRWIKRDTGTCSAVQLDGRPITVKARACCTRWDLGEPVDDTSD